MTNNECRCCGVNGADMSAGIDSGRWDMDIIGTPYREACLNEHGYAAMSERIRARQASWIAKSEPQSKCKSRHLGQTCCKTGNHLVHQGYEGRACFGWTDYAAAGGAGPIVIVPVCAGDTPVVVECNARVAIEASNGVRVYGTQPEVLPQTLPAGTKTIACAPCGTVAAGSEVLLDGFVAYRGEWPVGARNGVHASFIDWATTPVQEEKPTCGSVCPLTIGALPCATCDLGAGHDGYHEGGEALHRAKWSDENSNQNTVVQLPDGRAISVVRVGGSTRPADASTQGAPVLCRECSRPERPIAATTSKGLCAYCSTWAGRDGVVERLNFDANVAEYTDRDNGLEARVRLAEFDRRSAPRVTATTRSLAAGHPSNWPSVEGED